MTAERLIDAITRRKYPEAFDRLSTELRKQGPAYELAEVDEYWRQRWREHLSQFDTTILDEAGLTVDELVEMRDTKVKQRQSGKGGQVNSNFVETFADSVIRAELAELTFKETVDLALEDLNKEYNYQMKRSMAHDWLSTAIRFKACNIEPPKLGRPKKNP